MTQIIFFFHLQKARAEKERLKQEAADAAALTNGSTKLNGTESNGTSKLITNGTASKAADYYVKGELPTELTQRKIQK